MAILKHTHTHELERRDAGARTNIIPLDRFLIFFSLVFHGSSIYSIVPPAACCAPLMRHVPHTHTHASEHKS